ncbi:unnamed protein product, partial [Pocillopora meandrina]
ESLHALVVFVLVPIARAMISTIFLTDYNSGCDLGSDGKDDMESELRDIEADRQKMGCSIYHLKQLSQWGIIPYYFLGLSDEVKELVLLSRNKPENDWPLVAT